jgi:2',3'-cyclic-nucleotide 2'-phosphodiesterase (5'-nucleotidase family)
MSRPHPLFVLSALSALSAIGFAACGNSTTSGDGTSTSSSSSSSSGGSTSDGGGSSSGGGDSGGTTSGGSPDSASPGSSLRFVAFGDSRDNPTVHKAVVDAMAKKNPQLVLDSGDLWAGYTSAQWKTITTANQNIADLLNNNLYLVSRGNHETVSELLAFQPTLVRANKETYGFALGNTYFVSVGMDPSAATAFLGTELQKPEAQGAKWRIVFSHYPIYDSGSTHGVNGNTAVEKLCDQYHVTAFISGHEHIYERSFQMFSRAVVDRTDTVKAAKGTVYLVSGGAGAPFYDVTTPLASSRTNKTHVNHYMLFNASDTAMTVDTLDPNDAVLDHFEIDQ